MKPAPSNTQIAIQALTTIRNKDNLLFSQTPYFWKLSDLSVLYPNYFDIKTPISQSIARQLDETVIKNIPEFASIVQHPVHILTVNETYNIGKELKDNTWHGILQIRNGHNQHFTNVACEYLFGTKKGSAAQLAQAYFLFPNKTAEEIVSKAKEIRFERIRNAIIDLSTVLSGIVNRARYANKDSFSEVWALIWRNLYNVSDIHILRDKYGIKTSPIDYVAEPELIEIYLVLNEIIQKLANIPSLTIDEVKNWAARCAYFARTRLISKGKVPESNFTGKNSYNRLVKIRNARKKFWMENYQISL